MKPNNPFATSGYRGPECFCDRIKETGKAVSALANEIRLFATKKIAIGAFMLAAGLMAASAAEASSQPRTVEIAGPAGRAVLDLKGGRILSWKDAAGRELLFMPRQGESPDGDWSHGGISLCWPWFGKKGDKASSIHGFARNRMLTLRRRDASSVSLGLSLAAGEVPDFPYAVDLDLAVRITDRLEMAVRTTNTGETPFTFSEGIQPYFAVSKYGAVALRGVKKDDFAAVAGMDAAFPRIGDEFALLDAGAGHGLYAFASGNTGVVVWSPGNVEPPNRNLEPGDPERFIGLGPSSRVKEGAIVLLPGKSHTLVFRVKDK